LKEKTYKNLPKCKAFIYIDAYGHGPLNSLAARMVASAHEVSCFDQKAAFFSPRKNIRLDNPPYLSTLKKLKAQSSKLKAQSSKLKAQSSKLKGKLYVAGLAPSISWNPRTLCSFWNKTKGNTVK
jgi:hypothetical protein